MERLRTYRSLHMRCIGVALAFARCYSRFSMATKRSKIDKAVESVAKIIQAQLDTLPPSVAKAKRKELHQLVLRVSRSSSRGKSSRSARTGDLRPLSRSRAKNA